MAKRIQLVLTKDVSKLGRNGDLVEVAPGYAKNYLVPQGLASFTTPGILRQAAQRREKERERLLAVKAQAEAQKTALETIGRFAVTKPVGEGNAIFGTLTSQDLADVILEKTGQEIDRRGIEIPDVHSLGTYKASVKLHADVTANIEVQIVAAKVA
ncbi:50S ribosomal protein L9 [Leptolyngbya sp. CCY15150]|uniref:50S ribosomal protein L9 n=1 Tax=Leptolyngbya sp. CCY15150 TaxID=2767772 RepID=UPI0019517A90|nr:50S ribosomal protein L9 [Leptolyngbya sp. CCY15150]